METLNNIIQNKKFDVKGGTIEIDERAGHVKMDLDIKPASRFSITTISTPVGFVIDGRPWKTPSPPREGSLDDLNTQS